MNKLWLYLGIAVIVIFILLVLRLFIPQADATQRFFYICHVEKPDEGGVNQQTLHLPLPAVLAHLRQHDADYRGECEEPEPTPTEEPEPTPTEEPECKEDCEEPEEPTPTQPPVSSYAPPSDRPNDPSCTFEYKPAEGLHYIGQTEGGRKVGWFPSTDNPDKQFVLYGYSPDSLSYATVGLEGWVSDYTIGATDLDQSLWFSILSVWGDCNNQSEIIDP